MKDKGKAKENESGNERKRTKQKEQKRKREQDDGVIKTLNKKSKLMDRLPHRWRAGARDEIHLFVAASSSGGGGGKTRAARSTPAGLSGGPSKQHALTFSLSTSTATTAPANKYTYKQTSTRALYNTFCELSFFDVERKNKSRLYIDT